MNICLKRLGALCVVFGMNACKSVDDTSLTKISDEDPCIGVTKPIPGTDESTVFPVPLNKEIEGATEQERECFAEQEQDESLFMMAMMEDLQQQTSKLHAGKDRDSTLRGFHAKSHGCLSGRMYAVENPAIPSLVSDAQTEAALKNVSQRSKVGIWKRPAGFSGSVPKGYSHYYPAFVRFSNAQGIIKRDSNPDGKGMAIKVWSDGLAGDQDFTMSGSESCNGATAARFMAFGASLAGHRGEIELPTENANIEAQSFLESFKRRAKVTKQNVNIVPASFQFLLKEDNRQILGNSLGTVRSSIVNDPLPSKVQYWSRTPYRLGDYAVKYLVTPKNCCSKGSGFEDIALCPDSKKGSILSKGAKFLANRAKGLKEAAERRVRLISSADSWRKNLIQAAAEPICYEFSYQFQVSADKNPVENPTILWSKTSPSVVFGRLVMPPQDFESESQNRFCENSDWSPANFLEAHKPIGHMNRMRNIVYTASRKNRHAASGASTPKMSDYTPRYLISGPYFEGR